jgi:PAP2 superfamily
MKGISKLVLACIFLMANNSCNNGNGELSAGIVNNPEFIHKSVKRLNDVVIYEIFAPPVASRIYAYATLSAYEAMRWSDTTYLSLTAQLRGFPSMPRPDKDKKYNFSVAGVKALFDITKRLTFRKDSSRITEEALLKELKGAGIDKKTFDNSVQFGEAVAVAIWQRATKDNYKEIQGMARYSPKNEPGKWTNTPPDYLDAVQPFWNKMMPLKMDSCSQFKPAPPPPVITKEGTDFYKEMTEVYKTGKSLTEEQKTIARFWDDNPAAVMHVGHMMLANKKPSPGGHWMNITAIACRRSNANMLLSAQAYAMVAITMYEAFISCWDEKYRSDYPRPVTMINHLLDKNWEPLLQTPPFPEYTSGHSVVSSSIAAVLTKIFGDNFVFTDDYELPYIGIKRSFNSFKQASEEACVSRLYGGIHYKSAIENGKNQGRNLGAHLISSIRLAK